MVIPVPMNMRCENMHSKKITLAQTWLKLTKKKNQQNYSLAIKMNENG